MSGKDKINKKNKKNNKNNNDKKVIGTVESIGKSGPPEWLRLRVLGDDSETTTDDERAQVPATKQRNKSIVLSEGEEAEIFKLIEANPMLWSSKREYSHYRPEHKDPIWHEMGKAYGLDGKYIYFVLLYTLNKIIVLAFHFRQDISYHVCVIKDGVDNVACPSVHAKYL